MSNIPLFPHTGELLPYDPSAVFFPDFLSPSDADTAFREIRDTTNWEEQSLLLFGKQVLEPRLSAWVSDGVSYTYSRSTRHPITWTPILSDIRHRCEQLTSAQFNGVLANYYRDGHDHMGWHADDEPANGPSPTIASVSFGATRRFDFRHNDTKEIVSIDLTHGSLLVMSQSSQHKWKHRIAKQSRVNTPRVNLTFRFVDPDWRP